MNYQVAFIGCGNMGGVLARSVASVIGGEGVALCDTLPEKTAPIVKEYGATALSLEECVKNARVLFLGVKPQGLPSLLNAVRNIGVSADQLIVSMATGIRISLIEEALGLPVIRIMPNTPVATGKGVILYATSKTVSETDEKNFLYMTSKAGLVEKIAEDKIDAASIVTGCAPAFVYQFIEAMADGAVECGIPRAQALELAAQTALGASKMVLKYGNPGTLKDNVCSPGGTTIAGVHALEKDGLRAAAMDAVLASYQKTLALKK